MGSLVGSKMASNDAIAQWVRDTRNHGVYAQLVSNRNIGRHGTFSDALTKTKLRLSGQGLEFLDSNLPPIQITELKSIEGHSKRPSSPVFRTADADVPLRLATVRWNRTGTRSQHGEYAHLVFPTNADANAFCMSMQEVQRFGIRGILSGKHQRSSLSAPQPADWQIARGRERFARAKQKWLRQRAGPVCDASPAEIERERSEAIAKEFDDDKCDMFLAEDAEMHMRWAEALGGRSDADLSREELQELVDLGVPLKYRHQLWPRWVARPDLGDVEGLQDTVGENVAKQIELDIPRTQPKWLNDRDRVSLQRVLRAYAARNPVVGYCQGMNFITMIFILLGFDEATIFAGLSFIVEEVCPQYHSPNLEGYMRDTEVFGVLVHHLLPSLHNQLEAADLQLNILAMDHFISLASRSWSFGPVVRLWDIILLEGTSAVFASLLSTLELYLPRALEHVARDCTGGALGATEIMAQLKTLVAKALNHELDRIIEHTRLWLGSINQRMIDMLREEITRDD